MNTLTKSESRAAADVPASTRAYQAPRVDIYETGDHYVLVADMPGVAKRGLEILLDKNELSIGGQVEAPSPKGDQLYHETTSRDYRRTFVLDPEIDAEKIEAQLDQGVLTLTLPKAEKVKPRRIPVTG